MRYHLRYYRDTLDRLEDYALLYAADTVEELITHRKCSGDLVVESKTDMVVSDESWLFPWERGNPHSYANNWRGKHRPGWMSSPDLGEIFGRYGII